METIEVKTISFAVVYFGVAFTVAYLITGSVALGGLLALVEPIVNTGAFYLHERAWTRWGNFRVSGPATANGAVLT